MTDLLLAKLDSRGLLEDATRIAMAYGVTVGEMMSRRRFRPYVYARQQFWAELYARGFWSLPRIGALFEVDHTTVAYGIQAHRLRQCGAATPIEVRP